MALGRSARVSEDRLDSPGLLGRPVSEALPGQANGPQTGFEGRGVVVAVAVERRPVGVVLVAVELDDQTRLGKKTSTSRPHTSWLMSGRGRP